MLGRTEEPDISMLCPKKQTSGTSCEGWICGCMHPWDLSWQTIPQIWSVARFNLKLTFWTWAGWRSRSELEDLKWDTTPHPSLELWKTGCKTRFPCWNEVHILWPLSLTELSLIFPLPEPAGGPPRWTTPLEPGRARPELYLIPFFYSLQDPTRYIWQKFPRWVLIGLSLRASGLLPRSFRKIIITVLGPVLHIEGCGWAHFLCPHYLVGGARKATLCLNVWGCSRSAAPEIWVWQGRSFWNVAACVADSWNLSTTDLTALSKRSEGKKEHP